MGKKGQAKAASSGNSNDRGSHKPDIPLAEAASQPTAAASFLFPKPALKSFDSELDAFFSQPSNGSKSSQDPVSAKSQPSSSSPADKKRKQEKADQTAVKSSKKSKTSKEATKVRVQGNIEGATQEDGDDDDDDEVEKRYDAKRLASSKLKIDRLEREEEGDGEDFELSIEGLSDADLPEPDSADEMDVDEEQQEEASADIDIELVSEEDGEDAEEDEEEDNDHDDEEDDENSKTVSVPVHESVSKKLEAKARKQRLEEPNEPSEIKDKRTLFVGNIPIDVVTSKSLTKALRRHIASFSPYPSLTSISSIRFRSVPFSVPTNDFTAESEEQAESAAKRRERSRAYREALAAADGKSEQHAQQFLNPKQKRKVAFINQELNSHADSVNAYITIRHPETVIQGLPLNSDRREKAEGGGSSSGKAGRVGGGDAEVVELFDKRLTGPVLAALIASAADESLFESRHLRVDLVKPLEPSEIVSAGLDKTTNSEGLLIGSSSNGVGDPKRTLFVGNLDFEAGEEEVRGFFEKLVRDERGNPPPNDAPLVGLDGKPPIQPKLAAPGGAGESVDTEVKEAEGKVGKIIRPSEWVRSVRIVRDKATQMGKGFAYVRFVDIACVDEIMAIHEAEEAFLQTARSGTSAAAGKFKSKGGKKAGGISGSVLASTMIASGEKEFKRRLKFKGRALRVSRCKSNTGVGKKQQSTIKGGGVGDGGVKGEKPKGSPSLSQPSTPARPSSNSSLRQRSSGAPTPNGTSPFIRNQQQQQQQGTPTKAFAVKPTSTASVEEKAKALATLGKEERSLLKKSDPERQARRMEKKQKKVAAIKILKGSEGAASGKKEKVKLNQNKASKDRKAQKVKAGKAKTNIKGKSGGPGGAGKSGKGGK